MIFMRDVISMRNQNTAGDTEEQEGSSLPERLQSLSNAELQEEYVSAKQSYKKQATSDTTRRLAIARREMRRRQLPEA